MTAATRTNRREFLTAAAAAGSAFAARSWWTAPAEAAEVRSANSEFRVAVIGAGVRGKYLIGNLPPHARVTAICDCSTTRMAETLRPQGEYAKILAGVRGGDARRCKTYQDYRQLLDREKLDAAIIATPDHHHTLPAMLALKKGLHVYLEKPLTVTIREGRLLADMVQRTGRALQVGSQQRTMEINRFACEFIRGGELGKIKRVELPNYPGPLSNPRLPEEPIPDNLDWSLFLGPAPKRPYNRKLWIKDEFKVGNLMWRGWDLWRDYSGHLMTNWGAHSVDMVQYALGRDDTGPVSVEPIEPDSAAAGFRGWGHKTPPPRGKNERRFWPLRMRYADGVELTFLGPNDPIRFHGERGVMKVRRNYFEVDPPDLVKDGPGPEAAKKWAGAGFVARPHLENWLEAISSSRPLNAPVEVGHRTATICHLGNLARELNRRLTWNPKTEQFANDEAANKLLDRPRRKGFELPG